MAYDVFLDIKGVEGESTAKGFEKKIEIYSFSWGA
jgi:type VI secretion system secreted protein Hcp